VAVEFGSPRPPPPFAYVGRGDVFAPSMRGRVIRGEQARTIEAHTQVYGGGASGQQMARAGMRGGGPPPSRLGIEASKVPHPSPQDHGVAHAQAFAHPSTAQAVGGHPPVAHVVRSAPAVSHAGQASTVRPEPQHTQAVEHGGAGAQAAGMRPEQEHTQAVEHGAPGAQAAGMRPEQEHTQAVEHGGSAPQGTTRPMTTSAERAPTGNPPTAATTRPVTNAAPPQQKTQKGKKR
jgi:hypothetical protein